MKKQLLLGIVLLGALLMPQTMKAQSTEGKDFWVTFMRACDNKPTELILKFSAKQPANVHIENTYTGYTNDTISLGANEIKTISLNSNEWSSCYVADNDDEIVTNKALHIWSDATISVIAGNYRDKSFDVAAIMPTAALRSEHYIQCYTPSAHGGDTQQGTHFAIIAAEDNVVVDYLTTVKTNNGEGGSYTDTLTTPVMMKGQVFYVWTGEGGGDKKDFSGSWVKARDGKKIAVFNGNPHTNIPYQIRDRDHIYSQAMPVEYWGTQFAVTSSLTTIDGASGVWERLDKVRIMALEDSTAVIINGDTAHIFSFEEGDSDDQKHFYEFEFGVNDSKSLWQTDPDRPNIKRIESTNCFIETSCPCAVHLFLTSNQYDHAKDKSINEKYCNGDPSQIWINPIEQKIKTLTFGTFETTQVKDHFINIITSSDNVNSIKLDGENISGDFQPMIGNSEYQFARKKIIGGTHTMTSDSGFIAHVYGFGEKESYGYPAGGNTIDLSQLITINGDTLKQDVATQICRSAGGSNTIHFECKPNYEYEAITWNFGDGTPIVSGKKGTPITLPDGTIINNVEEVNHTYARDNLYHGYVLIERNAFTKCGNRNLKDSFPMEVELEYLTVEPQPITDNICSNNDAFRIYYVANRDLEGSAIDVEYDAKAQADGFSAKPIMKKDADGSTYFHVMIPSGVKDGSQYSINISMDTKCDHIEKEIPFSISYAAQNVLARLWENTIAVWTPEEMKALIKEKDPSANIGDITFDSYKWYKRDTTETREYTLIENEHESFLLKDRLAKEDIENNVYYVDILYTEKKADGTTKQNTLTSCPIGFNEQAVEAAFNADSLINGVGGITFNRIDHKNILVMTAQDATASWINTSGSTVMSKEIRAGGGMMALPDENGLYILKVEAGKNTKSMKIMIQ